MSIVIQALFFNPCRYVANKPGKNGRIRWTESLSEARRFACAGDAAGWWFEGFHNDWPAGIRPVPIAGGNAG
jgi:hypothetical protein